MERKARCFRTLTFALCIVFSLWVLVQVIAPIALPDHSVEDLSGLVGISDNEHVIQDMVFPWNTIYTCGDRLCHQIDDRSFFLNGNQLPFCSRCLAIWIGIAVGMAFMVFHSIELNEKFIFLLLIGLVPIGIDGVGQLIGFWESINIVRFITGLLAGIVVGISMGVIIDEIHAIRKTKKVIGKNDGV